MTVKKNRGFLARLPVSVCVITTGITLLEGVLGSLFLPEQRLPFTAFLVPPVFGLLTALTGLVVESRRELTKRQMLFRMAMQLVLIETMIFGVNHLTGRFYSLKISAAMALGILAVFVFVYLMMWFNESRTASAFNRKLARWQRDNAP